MDLSNVKLMWTNYPNMPTGANASMELYEKLVAFGKKHGIIICNDNPYSFILNEHPLSILAVPGAKDICIEMNSMSKAHNMPGWRMAMLASNAQFVQWVLKIKSNIDSGQFKPMQYAAVEALSAPKEWYDNMNRVYRSRRDHAHVGMRIRRKAGRYVPLGENPSRSRRQRSNSRQSPVRSQRISNAGIYLWQPGRTLHPYLALL